MPVFRVRHFFSEYLEPQYLCRSWEVLTKKRTFTPHLRVYEQLPKKKPGVSHPPLPRISDGGGPPDAARLIPRPVARRDLSEY